VDAKRVIVAMPALVFGVLIHTGFRDAHRVGPKVFLIPMIVMRAGAEKAAVLMTVLLGMGFVHKEGIAVVFVRKLNHAANGQIAFMTGDKVALVAVAVAIPIALLFIDLEVAFSVIIVVVILAAGGKSGGGQHGQGHVGESDGAEEFGKFHKSVPSCDPCE
jgi:hypothetical protein